MTRPRAGSGLLPSLLRERARHENLITAMDFADPSAITASGSAELRLSVRDLGRWWKTAATTAPENAAWNLYLHVPYCKSICTFCNYQRLRVSSLEALDEYVRFLVAEIRHLAPALEDVQFGALYVGGGTPSVLTAAQLDALMDGLHQAFRFRPDAQKTFEYDPMVMTDDRFRVLDRFGFRRYSFGIQTLDVSANRLLGRGAQDRRHVDRQFTLLERHGAHNVNVDFLLGLAGTTPKQMVADIERVLSDHEPPEVSVYWLSPTATYIGEHFSGDYAAFEAFLRDFETLVPAALGEVAQRRNYTLEQGKHALRLRRETPTLRGRRGLPRASQPATWYCDIPSEAHRPLYLLGLGDSARSRIFGRLRYRAEHDSADHDPTLPRYVGGKLSMADEVWSYVSHALRDGDVIDRALFRRTFGEDIEELCGRALDKLTRLGVLSIDEQSVTMAPQPRRERLRDLLFFAPRRVLRTSFSGAGRTGAVTPLERREVARLVEPVGEKGALTKGWMLELVAAGSVEIAAPGTRLRVRLLEPAGAHPACRSTARYDLQYDVVAGHPDPRMLDAALDALAALIARNERGAGAATSAAPPAAAGSGSRRRR